MITKLIHIITVLVIFLTATFVRFSIENLTNNFKKMFNYDFQYTKDVIDFFLIISVLINLFLYKKSKIVSYIYVILILINVFLIVFLFK